MKQSYVTVTDQFCGAGGSSLGAVACGAEVVMALNHWRLAIDTHNHNFPQTAHDCTDISACDPRRYPSTDILITSPECTNHSLAKGVKRPQRQASFFDHGAPDPAAERSRATMWDVCRFAEFHQYNFILVENVPDARQWVMWPAWIQAMTLLGYEHQVVYLNSMFCWPTPQSRDRMYVVFWKRGNKAPDLDFHPSAYCSQCERNVEGVQSWKNPTKRWGKYKQQYVYRCPACASEVQPYYYAALNAIDWRIPVERIGDRKRPLKEKTLARIRYGLEKFGRQAFLASPNHSDLRARGVTEPMATQTANWNYGLAVSPFIVPMGYTHEQHDRRSFGVDSPMPTQSTRQEMGLCIPPFIAELRNHSTARELDEALATVTAGGGHHGLVIPPAMIVANYSPGWARPATGPLGTVTTKDRHAVVVPPFLVSYYGERHATHGLDEALPTVPGMALHYLAQPGEVPAVEDCGFRMLQPTEIQTAMAFPGDYVVKGNQREKIKQLGNAVTPPAMTFLMQRCLATLG